MQKKPKSIERRPRSHDPGMSYVVIKLAARRADQ